MTRSVSLVSMETYGSGLVLVILHILVFLRLKALLGNIMANSCRANWSLGADLVCPPMIISEKLTETFSIQEIDGSSLGLD